MTALADLWPVDRLFPLLMKFQGLSSPPARFFLSIYALCHVSFPVLLSPSPFPDPLLNTILAPTSRRSSASFLPFPDLALSLFHAHPKSPHL
jgi:hypothetical protein